MTLGKAGVSGSGPDLFDQPTDVVVAPNGDIFVTDSHRNGKNNRVVKFSKDGKFIKEWGTKGSGPGEISEPHTIAMDSRGRLFVGDRENNRIQIFDQDGTYIDRVAAVRPSERDLHHERRHHLRRRFGVGPRHRRARADGDQERHPDRQRQRRDGDGVHRGHGVHDEAIIRAPRALASTRRATFTAPSSGGRCSSATSSSRLQRREVLNARETNQYGSSESLHGRGAGRYRRSVAPESARAAARYTLDRQRRMAVLRRRSCQHALFATRSNQRVEFQHARCRVAVQDRFAGSSSRVQAGRNAADGQRRSLYDWRHASVGDRARRGDRRVDLGSQRARRDA